MYPAAFEYHAPTSVQEALGLLGKLKDDAKILAGGHSLIPMMKLRLAQPKHLIDLRKVPGLAGIKDDKGTIVIGAMTTHWQVESSPLLREKCPIVSDTAGIIGDPAVRNLGTIGGSLAHADPAADMPATVIALGAEFVCEGPKGRRTVKVDEWFQGLMATAVREDEILVEIRIPAWPAGSGGAYLKFPHPASRFAVVGAGAMVTLDGKGVCSKAGVGITGAGTKAVRATGVEAGLAGKTLDAATIEAAAQKAAEGVDVQADLQGSVEYKSHLCRVFARRALEAAVKRAKG
ncbi:MAG: xanthine dehydrogenase family protein subunit M [Candidatus Rokubacteria bacterium]|nr:xanthine dehydrogenase family protein subunit M [Candidatus Rokubacteria bacterium]